MQAERGLRVARNCETGLEEAAHSVNAMVRSLSKAVLQQVPPDFYPELACYCKGKYGFRSDVATVMTEGGVKWVKCGGSMIVFDVFAVSLQSILTE